MSVKGEVCSSKTRLIAIWPHAGLTVAYSSNTTILPLVVGSELKYRQIKGHVSRVPPQDFFLRSQWRCGIDLAFCRYKNATMK